MGNTKFFKSEISGKLWCRLFDSALVFSVDISEKPFKFKTYHEEEGNKEIKKEKGIEITEVDFENALSNG